MINHDPHKNKVKITHSFNEIKIIQIDTILKINLHIIQLIIFHQMMKIIIMKIINNFIQTKDLDLTLLTNQIFSNNTHEMNKHDNLEITQHLTTIIFNNKTQLIHNLATQLNCIMKSLCDNIYNNMK